MTVHETFDFERWAARFPLEKLRDEARRRVEDWRRKNPDSRMDWDRCLRGQLPHADIVTGPIDIVKLELLRREKSAAVEFGSSVPTDVFIWCDGEPVDPRVTKLGGVPYRDRSQPWPQDESGQARPFVGQLQFGDSRDLVPALPSDLLLIFGGHGNDEEESFYHFEWGGDVSSPIEALPCCEYVRPCHGQRHRTVDYLADPWDVPVEFDFRLLEIAGTKIGGVPFWIQGEPLSPVNVFAVLSSITNQFGPFPFCNVDKLPWTWQNRPKPNYLEIGHDEGSLYLSLDEAGESLECWVQDY